MCSVCPLVIDWWKVYRKLNVEIGDCKCLEWLFSSEIEHARADTDLRAPTSVFVDGRESQTAK